MSKDELSPEKIMAELNQWKTQFGMQVGRATQIIGDANSAAFNNCFQLISTLIGENQKLKQRVNALEAEQIKPKIIPKTEKPAGK